MRKTIILFMVSMAWVTSLLADGVAGALSDPQVVPIVRGPDLSNDPLNAPLTIIQGGDRYGACHNSQNPGTPPVAAGYELRFACDHIVVGLGLLGGLYLLGSAASTN